MKRWFGRFYDRLLVVAASGLLVTSCFWAGRQQTAVRHLRAQPVMARMSASRYEPVPGAPIVPADAGWSPPAEQSAGTGWLFEVFTPPDISLDRTARSFVVRGPPPPAGDGAPFGLELLGVKLEPFRVQLAGYFGAPGDYAAAFTGTGLSGTMLARAGDRLDKVGLTLKSVAVKQLVVASTDSGPVPDVTAIAVVYDEQTGIEVELSNRRPRLTDKPLAECRMLTGSGQRCVLSEGDAIADGLSTYRIDHIRMSPPEVTVARLRSGSSQPESRILSPVVPNPSHPSVGKAARSADSPQPLPDRLAVGGN